MSFPPSFLFLYLCIDVLYVLYLCNHYDQKVLAVVPTDKTLPTGERCVRFKALAIAGDCNGHVGLGVQISKEVAVAIAGLLFWPSRVIATDTSDLEYKSPRRSQ